MDIPKTDSENGSLDAPVVVIGGGPTGLLVAHLLSRLGIRSVVIERYSERLGAPKAHALSPRSLEICRQFTLDVNAIRQQGTKRMDARWVNFLTSLDGEAVGRLPYERMDVDVLLATPEMVHNIPQPNFEQFLSEQLSRDPNVEIRKGVSFVSLEQDKDGATTIVEERTTSQKFEIRSKFLVACDGARSKVRTHLGIESEGEHSYETMMTIHFNANLRPVVKERVGMLHWIMDPQASGFIIGYDLSGNEVLISNFDSKQHPIESWNENLCRQVVMSAIGTDIEYDILSYRPWILSRNVAKEYRRQHVFLAGDAAHSFPPTGGLGLNSGLADVHNLAWKIAAVLRGTASDSLLDTYEADRRHVAEVNSQQSVKNGQKIFSLLKTLGMGNSTSLEEARSNLFATIHDPAKQDEIAAGIEGQREHFDNLELHIGYVYGSTEFPSDASNYVPKFVPGARLPHSWIIPKSKDAVQNLQPVDVSYVEELSKESVDKYRYSTLDLCPEGAFTLLVAEDSCLQAWRSDVVLRRYSSDFTLVDEKDDWASKTGLTTGGALLVRPDQHIVALFDKSVSEASVENVLSVLLR